jgi:predicted dehydrogenase
MEGDDTSIVVIRFESGAIGTLTELFGHHSCDGFRPRITPRPAGRRQWKLGLEGGAITLAAVTGNRREAARTESIGVIESQDSFLAEVEHFLVSIRNDQEPLTSGRAQQRALELVPAAYASMNDGGTWCG